MMYLTATELAQRIGFDELLRIVASVAKVRILPEVLVAVLEDSTLSAFVPEQRDVAQKVADRISLALGSADALINSYVSARHPNGLSTEAIAASPLPQIASYLVKHDLMVVSDEQTRLNYKHALEQLRDISKGTISLGDADPNKPVVTAMSVGRSNSQFDFGAFGR